MGQNQEKCPNGLVHRLVQEILVSEGFVEDSIFTTKKP